MQLRYGTQSDNATAQCCGCHQVIDCSQQYITLQLDNHDGTLQPTDYAFSHFHNEHCVSQAMKQLTACDKG